MYEKAFLVPLYLAGAAVVCFLYALFLRRLAERVEPLREDMADIGKKLMESDALSAQDTEIVKMGLATSKHFMPMVVLVIVSPFAMVAMGIRKLLPAGTQEEKRGQPEQIQEFQKKLVISWMAANPVFAGVEVLEVLVFMVIFILFSKSRSLLMEPITSSVASTERIMLFISNIISIRRVGNC